MTAAKPIQRKEVDKVMASLRSALAQECPGYDDQVMDFPPALAEPTAKRAKVLLEAYRRAWAASNHSAETPRSVRGVRAEQWHRSI